MSETDSGSDGGQINLGGKMFPRDLTVTISFRLHEAVAIGVLYEAAPEDLNLRSGEQDWGFSVDLGILRLVEGIARATKDKEMLLRAGASRARIDQRA